MNVKELDGIDFFLQASERFIGYLQEMREIYIQSAEQKVLLGEEVPIMEEIIISWQALYQNIKQLQIEWERRSSFYKDHKEEILHRMKQESSFLYMKLQKTLREGE